jgi:hypothetical protein
MLIKSIGSKKMNKRELIFNKTGGKCLYCGCDLSGLRWQADHFYPLIRVNGKPRNPELDVIDNLFPACGPCNNFKSSNSIEGMRMCIKEQFVNVPKNSTGCRQLMRLNLVDISEKPVVFWFEKNGIKIKEIHEILGFSEKSKLVKWEKEYTEDMTYYSEIGRFIVTLRHLGSEWLAIATSSGFYEQYRTHFPNGTTHFLQAAEWALNLE